MSPARLGQHILAVPAFLDHPDHVADLTLPTAQPPDDVGKLLAVGVRRAD